MRTLKKAGAGAFAALLGTLALALLAAPAMAAYIHPTSTGAFGSDGTNATTIPGLERLAFDQASHRLYTLNQNPPKIGAFDVPSLAAHTPTAGFPVSAPELGFRADIAVDRNTGNVYVVSSTGGLYGFDSAGAPLPGSFPVKTQGETPCGVGVDSQGHVWVSDTTSEKIKEYSASGAPIGSPVDVKNIGGPCKIAFDYSNDDMYVASSSSGLYRLTAASGYTERILLQDVRAYTLAVDSVDHVVFASNIFENGVAAFDPSGRLLETVGAGAPPGLSPYGLAFDESTRALYLANPVTGKILVYPGVIVPDVTTGEQTGNATLNGSVDPASGGPITECKFEYGERQNFGGGQIQYTASVPCDQSTPIANPTNVTADVAGVATFEKEYDFRLVAKNANGTNRGLNHIFTVHRVSGLHTDPASAITRESATLNGSFIGTNDETSYFFNWGTSEGNLSHTTPTQNAGKTTGNTSTPFTLGNELTPGTTYYYRVVASNSLGGQSLANIVSFTTVPSVLDLKTEPATNVGKESAELNGSFTGDNNDTHYYFEYGSSAAYGKSTPLLDAGTTTGQTALPPVTLSELVQAKEYHFRVVAENSFGTTYGEDRVFETVSPPTIVGASSSGVTATTADLNAVINPRGAETTYFFEYGLTPDYGSVAPIPAGTIPAGTSDTSKSVHIENLVSGGVYHFRVVASNSNGVVSSPDQVFNFYPERCPNDTVRQQTGADGLPDCRAYELVTPENAGNAMIYGANVPFSPTATSPSRLAFVGALGIVPGTEGASNVQGDLYVATRKTSGWDTKIVGLPVKQAYISGGPPWIGGESSMDKWYLNVETNSSMSNMVMWNDGYFPGTYTLEGEGVESSNAPYLFDSNTGDVIDRWPTNVGAIPGGQRFKGMTLTSEDLSHFVFKSDVAFLPGAAPGTIYDNDTTDESLTVVSLNEEEQPIDAAPVEMSRNGSHILMTVGGARNRYRPTSGPGELFMRVNDEKTYDIAKGTAVEFVGMTPDGSKVYFTTNQKLAEDGSDTDTSTDLYQWSESSSTPNHLTLISAGNNGNAGNSDSCGSSWTSQCNAVPIFTTSYSAAAAGLGGSPFSDSALAANGDIFFLSPEQLVGDNGVTGDENLYYHHHGQLKFVTALEPGTSCTLFGTCSETSVARIEVSPDGSHMAFLTSSRVTGYDNAGFSEMYTYEPDTGQVTCASCLTGGATPTSNVIASHNGLFMTDDGRAFFETTDAVVPADTNEVADVYEFVNSRPRLISSGTAPGPNENTISTWGPGGTRPGLVGVSADGTDVFFATYDVLVGQDRNGDSIKIYDARTGGGFPFVPPTPGCAAADECHGAGSELPAPALNGTGAGLGNSGNLEPQGKQKKRKSSKAHSKKRGRAASKKRHPKKKGGRRHD